MAEPIFAISVSEGITWEATTAPLTASVKLLLAVAPVESVTVTVYFVAASVTEGVPVTTPLVALKESPAGNAGEMLYVSVPLPPAPVIGVKVVAGWLTVRVFDAVATVADTGPFTVSENVFVAVSLLVSVTVTVYVVAELAIVGVPVIAPVDVL